MLVHYDYILYINIFLELFWSSFIYIFLFKFFYLLKYYKSLSVLIKMLKNI